jgi:hypothetical protein
MWSEQTGEAVSNRDGGYDNNYMNLPVLLYLRIFKHEL